MPTQISLPKTISEQIDLANEYWNGASSAVIDKIKNGDTSQLKRAIVDINEHFDYVEDHVRRGNFEQSSLDNALKKYSAFLPEGTKTSTGELVTSSILPPGETVEATDEAIKSAIDKAYPDANESLKANYLKNYKNKTGGYKNIEKALAPFLGTAPAPGISEDDRIRAAIDQAYPNANDTLKENHFNNYKNKTGGYRNIEKALAPFLDGVEEGTSSVEDVIDQIEEEFYTWEQQWQDMSDDERQAYLDEWTQEAELLVDPYYDDLIKTLTEREEVGKERIGEDYQSFLDRMSMEERLLKVETTEGRERLSEDYTRAMGYLAEDRTEFFKDTSKAFSDALVASESAGFEARQKTGGIGALARAELHEEKVDIEEDFQREFERKEVEFGEVKERGEEDIELREEEFEERKTFEEEEALTKKTRGIEDIEFETEEAQEKFEEDRDFWTEYYVGLLKKGESDEFAEGQLKKELGVGSIT